MKTLLHKPIVLSILLSLLGLFFTGPTMGQGATGFKSPSAYSESGVSNAGSAYVSDNNRAYFDDQGDRSVYYNFSFDCIPSGSTITGIEVKYEGYSGGTSELDVSLTWNDGSNYTTPARKTAFTGSESTLYLGGSSDTWGRTWSPSEFIGNDFRVRLVLDGGTGNVSLDLIQVNIHYSLPVYISPVIFNTSGCFVVPAGVTSITVQAWGGGGGGGDDNDGAGGGGGGAFASRTLTVEPGTIFTIVVGAGGTEGNNGGTSYFNSNSLVSSTSVVADGGNSTSGQTGGTGGSTAASNGTTKWAGGNGGAGVNGGGGGGGGGSAETSANGQNGMNAVGNNGGDGGAGAGDGGDGADDVSGSNGENGEAPGGGGGGRADYSGSNGGQGAHGRVIIMWETCTPVTPEVTIVSDPLDNTICAGTSVKFTATAINTGGGTVNYNFKIGSTSKQSGSSNEFTTNELVNGNEVTCEITITGGTCLTATSDVSNTITMTVNDNLTPEVSIVSDATENTICAGTSVTFTATPANTGGGTVSYQWKLNGSNVGDDQDTYTTTVLEDGDDVQVVITVTGGTCLTATTATSNTIETVVNANLTPEVSIASSDEDNTICAGTSVTFTATPSNTGGGTVSYQWKLNDDNVGTDQDTYSSTALADGDDVTCVITVTGGTCLTATTATSNSIETTVNPNLTPEVSIVSSDEDNTICVGTEVTFTATPSNYGSGTVSYQWKKNDSDVGTNDPTYTTSGLANGDEVKVVITITEGPVSPPDFSASFVVVGLCLTSTTATSNIITTVVNPLPAQPSPISGNGSVCEGSTQEYWVTNVPDVTYAWEFSGTGWVIQSGQGTNKVTVIVGTTNTTITVTPSNDCGNGTARTRNITYKPATSITKYEIDGVEIKFKEIVYGCKAPELKVTASGTTRIIGGYGYQWYVNTVNSNSGGTAIPLAITSTLKTDPGKDVGTYYYYVVVSGGCGSFTSDVMTVNIIPQPADGDPIAKVYYTGPKVAWTPTSTSNTATVTLSAFLINKPGEECGNISTARVTFMYKTGTTGTDLDWTPIPSAQNLPVNFVDPNNPSKGGTASAIVQLSISSSESSKIFDIKVKITGNYTNSPDAYGDVCALLVGKLIPGGAIGGGATLCNTNSTGFVKGVPLGTTACFGVQYVLKGGKVQSPKGNVTLYIYSYNDRFGNNDFPRLHLYYVKSNAIATLSIKSPSATFTAKANIAEINMHTGLMTSIEGNLTMVVDMTDGRPDLVGVTVYRNAGGVWYSNNWQTSKTVPAQICVGDVSVTGLATPPTELNSGSANIGQGQMTDRIAVKLNGRAYPNPATGPFNIKIESSDLTQPVKVSVFDLSGRVVETFDKVNAGTILRIGDKYLKGTYIVQLKQGDQIMNIKVIRL